MTSLQFTQGRISKKSRSFWSCFEAQLHHSFWSLSHTWIVWDIRYSDHFGKNFSTILKILNMQQLRNFLGRTSPLKASHIYLYLQIIQIQSLLLGHYPPTPPNLTPLLPQHSTKPIIIPLPTTQLNIMNICFEFRSLAGNQRQYRGNTICMPCPEGFQGRFGCQGL